MDGAVVIPKNVVDEVITDTEKVMNTESKMRNEILKGMDPFKSLLKIQKVLSLNIKKCLFKNIHILYIFDCNLKHVLERLNEF